MARPEWGIKHECPNCSIRFYDLLKPSPITCPSCSYSFATNVLHRVKKTKLVKDSDDEDEDMIETLDEDQDDTDEGLDSVHGNDLLLHDDEEDKDSLSETTDVSTIEDDMFPDDEDDVNREELPEDLLDDDLDEEVEDHKIEPQKK